MAIDPVMVVYGVVLAFAAGLALGMRSANRKWSGRGDDGYPRVEYRGRLYWVSRDDHRCFRCEE